MLPDKVVDGRLWLVHSEPKAVPTIDCLILEDLGMILEARRKQAHQTLHASKEVRLKELIVILLPKRLG